MSKNVIVHYEHAINKSTIIDMVLVSEMGTFYLKLPENDILTKTAKDNWYIKLFSAINSNFREKFKSNSSSKFSISRNMAKLQFLHDLIAFSHVHVLDKKDQTINQ